MDARRRAGHPILAAISAGPAGRPRRWYARSSRGEEMTEASHDERALKTLARVLRGTLLVVPAVYGLVARNTHSPEYVAQLIDRLKAASA